MAYDDDLAKRFRALVEGLPGLSEKRMMGGICFFLNGNMVGGADRANTGERRFMFRVGKDNVAAADALPGAEPMVQGGRTMTGLYFVNAEEQSRKVIKKWAALAIEHAFSLPPK